MEAIGYVRVSTHEQAQEGVSLAAQRERLEAYCAMRGLELVEVVTDAGVSGATPLDERPGGRRLLDLVGRGDGRHVVACKLDRLFRDAGDCLSVTKAWDRSGAALHLVDVGGQAVDTSGAMGRMVLTMLAGFAEFERNMISERTRAALAHKKAKGERVGGVPYGYRAGAGGQLIEDPAEQAAIARARELRASGLSIRKVAEQLASEGHRSRGPRWSKSTVHRLVAP